MLLDALPSRFYVAFGCAETGECACVLVTQNNERKHGRKDKTKIMVAEEQTSQRAQDRLDVLLHLAGFAGDVFWDAAPLQHHGVVIPVHDRLQQS